MRRSSFRWFRRPDVGWIPAVSSPPQPCSRLSDHQSCDCGRADRDSQDTTRARQQRPDARLRRGFAPEHIERRRMKAFITLNTMALRRLPTPASTRGDGEAGRLAQHADSVAEILDETLEEVAAERLVHSSLYRSRPPNSMRARRSASARSMPERSRSSARSWMCERSSASISLLIRER